MNNIVHYSIGRDYMIEKKAYDVYNGNGRFSKSAGPFQKEIVPYFNRRNVDYYGFISI